jgi:hypothetical protein
MAEHAWDTDGPLAGIASPHPLIVVVPDVSTTPR